VGCGHGRIDHRRRRRFRDFHEQRVTRVQLEITEMRDAVLVDETVDVGVRRWSNGERQQ
jgi:hypothetical protein